MSSQDADGRGFRRGPNGGGYPEDAAQRAGYQESARQRLRRDGGPGEDLFLSIALNESDLNAAGNKRLSMPVNPNMSSPTAERPRSSGNILGSPRQQQQQYQNQQQRQESFPVLDGFKQPRPRRNSPQYARDGDASSQDYGRGSTPTPSQYSYASRNSRYLAGNDQRSPDMLHIASGRPASNTFSEHMSQQRFHRLSGYDPSQEAGNNQNQNNHNHSQNSHNQSQEQDTDMFSPDTPVEPRPDPETESAGSVTAPSTVWDELDDLKSRIRNLEITGKTPSTSAAAIANHAAAERPRTATTAPTTISSSPQRLRKNSVVRSDVTAGGLGATDVHPLLHNALTKAKPLLNPALYRALEATAADALALAAMTGSTGPQGTTYSGASVVNGGNVSDRHIRRKADSMCRNVTDLCIALCEGKSEASSPGYRPSPPTTFRFQGNTPPAHFARRGSMEANEHTLRSSPSRTFSRLESRRSSLLGLGLNSSPREVPEQYMSQDSSPNQPHIDYAARYSRPGTSLLRTRYSGAEDVPEDPPIRAPSRATTEIGQMRPRRSDNVNGMQPRSPGLREALIARRTTMGIPEEIVDEQQYETPVSTYQDRLGNITERHRPAPIDAGPLTPNKRRRRITSLEQYASSPIPRYGNEPMRTTSLSRRRNMLGQ